MDMNAISLRDFVRMEEGRSISVLFDSLPLQRERRCIRLLDLDPIPRHGNHHTQVPLCGSLRVVSLQDSPRFTALSYVWGSRYSPETMLTISDRKLPLTCNCHAALTELRRRFGAVTIWVDAICINQHDVKEKEAQIPLMGEIYSWAKMTYIWLGDSGDQSGEVIQFLRVMASETQCLIPLKLAMQPPQLSMTAKHLAHLCVGYQLEYVHQFRRIPWTSTGWSQLVSILNSANKRATVLRSELQKGSVELFFERTWFQRVWCLQELVLTPDALFMCGNESITWDQLVRSVSELSEDFEVLPEGLVAFHWIIDLWSKLPRETHWNDILVRIPLHGRVTFANYFGRYESATFAWFIGLSVAAMIPLVGAVIVYIDKVTIAWAGAIWRIGTSTLRSRDPAKPPGWLAIWACLPLTTFVVVVSVVPFLYAALLIYFPCTVGTFLRVRVPGTYGKPHVLRVNPCLPLLGHWLRCLSRFLFPVKVEQSTYRQDRLLMDGLDGSLPADPLLEAVTCALRFRKASNALDKSYALYGIMQTVGAELAAVDYNKDKWCVYRELFSDLLKRNPKAIGLVLDAGTDTMCPSSGRPSWLPDWELLRHDSWIPTSYILNTGISSATGGSFATATIVGVELRLLQRVQDQVKFSLGRVPLIDRLDLHDPHKSSTITSSLGLLLNWIKVARRDAHLPASESLASSIQAALVGPGVADEGFGKWYEALTKIRPNMTSFRDLSPVEVAIEELSKSESTLRYHRKLCNLLRRQKRSVFITARGHVGTGPAHVLKDDIISLISGLSMPAILRNNPDGETFTFIGPSFCPGMMNGAYWSSTELSEVARIT